MIKDCLRNAEVYYNLSENIKIGLEWLKNNDLENLASGKYEIKSDEVFANIQEYVTKDDAKYEAHRKYIDIQYLVYGEEQIGVTDLENCVTYEKYDFERDLEFFDIKTDNEYQRLSVGEFLILYPHEAHKPSIAFKDKMLVKKIVVKVAVN